MRRTHLRRHQNILKGQLIHLRTFNLILIPRQLLGAGTPREMRNRSRALLLLVWVLLTRLVGPNRPSNAKIPASADPSLLKPLSQRPRCRARNVTGSTTGCWAYG